MADKYITPEGLSIRRLDGLFGIMRVSLLLFALCEVLLTGVNVITLRFIDKIIAGGFLTDGQMSEEANQIDTISMPIGILYAVVFIFSVIMVGRFVYRATLNLHVANAAGIKMSPGWAVGWYFIPIALLWKPFEGMSQIWRGSLDPVNGAAPIPPMLGWWWACWLLTNIIANISFRLGGGLGEPDSLEMLRLSLQLDFIGSGLGLASALLLIRITKRVTDAQSSLTIGGIADTFS